ncbi:monocarboxylate transporter 10-like isoform X2 [Mya arenaria]|uniref:monocarboxylate transporter 10-like isoform X2 n=1 Tax=Mya arenaria TaxID=6604 RepID=UPI0022E82CA0|nr:monocarboxylate transporter 10-like isoform X2 [Mya arenaria]
MKSHKRDVDGGWAWLALVAVYGGMLTLSTVMYTSGVLYVEMLEYYREDAAKTSVIGALNTGLMCLLGPLVSICINKYSCRLTMVIGGLFLMSAYLTSAFVSNINLLILFLGVIGGIITMSFASFDHLPFAEYAFAGAIGIFTGLPSALVTPMTLSLVDFGRISKAHGLVNFFSGLGYVTGPPIAAMLLERTGSYENSFMMSGAVLIFGSLIATVAKFLIRKPQEERENTNCEQMEEIQTFIPAD